MPRTSEFMMAASSAHAAAPQPGPGRAPGARAPAVPVRCADRLRAVPGAARTPAAARGAAAGGRRAGAGARRLSCTGLTAAAPSLGTCHVCGPGKRQLVYRLGNRTGSQGDLCFVDLYVASSVP